MGIGGAVVALASGFQLARAYFEEPEHSLVARYENMELRRYEPRIVAETFVSASDRDAATSLGFQRLAGYIFGGNRSIAMTTPVEATPASERIAMTTPVETAPAEEGWRVAFTMPSKYRLDDLPQPDDDRVVLRTIPARTVAAIRFRGRVTEATRRSMERELRTRVRGAGLRAVSPTTVAVYDPPHWVLPPFRRNEVMVDVAEPSALD